MADTVINFENMKQTSPERNFDNVDITNDFNVAAQNAQGLYGAFKFFHGIKSFFKGISALGTLATGSKVLVTDDNGNISYTTPQGIKDGLSLVDSTALNNALTDYRKKTDNSNEGVFKVPANTTVKTPINVNSGNSQKAGYLLMIEGNTSAGDLTYVELYLIRCGYSGNHVTQKLISSSGSKSAFSQTFGVSEDGYLTITSDIAVSYYIF